MDTCHKSLFSPDKRYEKGNPCLECGACCIVFRASFYWVEADDVTKAGVPVDLTEKVSPFRRAMRRNDYDQCIALRGEPGHKVRCTIYNRRPSVCRDFEPSWKIHNSACDWARAIFNLDPLS